MSAPRTTMPASSYKSASIGRDTVSPAMIVLSVAPMISCGYFSPIGVARGLAKPSAIIPTTVSYTHLRAHETPEHLV